MRTNKDESNNQYACPKCDLEFNCDNDLKAHTSKHSTSPPYKKQKNESELGKSFMDKHNKYTKGNEPNIENLDKEMGDLKEPEDISKQALGIEILENLDEEMGDLKDPDNTFEQVKTHKLIEVKQPAVVVPDNNETEVCFEFIPAFMHAKKSNLN